MRISTIEGDLARVVARGLVQEANIQLVPEAKVGDYVLIHAGFAIERLHRDWAEESLELWDQVDT